MVTMFILLWLNCKPKFYKCKIKPLYMNKNLKLSYIVLSHIRVYHSGGGLYAKF